MLALPSNPDSYELGIRFFFFFAEIFDRWWNTDVPSYEYEPNMPSSINARLCDILIIPMAFPAFVHFVLWVYDKLGHALISFAYYISTKNSWQALFNNNNNTLFHPIMYKK